jgi:hypothetical protein
MLFVVDRETYDAAALLMAEYGDAALVEASERASRSRELGNYIRYTLWCRAGRAILLLGNPEPDGLLH